MQVTSRQLNNSGNHPVCAGWSIASLFCDHVALHGVTIGHVEFMLCNRCTERVNRECRRTWLAAELLLAECFNQAGKYPKAPRSARDVRVTRPARRLRTV